MQLMQSKVPLGIHAAKADSMTEGRGTALREKRQKNQKMNYKSTEIAHTIGQEENSHKKP